MFIDNGLLFSNNQAITVSVASTTAIDLTGAGSGNAPNNVFGGSVYGADMGVGDGTALPKITCSVTTAFTSAGSPTMVISAQFAVDNGSNVAGSYQTYAETGAIPFAVTSVAGNQLGTFDLPRAPDGIVTYPLPRFIQLQYTVASGSFTGGKVFAGIVLQRQDLRVGAYGSNFTVAA